MKQINMCFQEGFTAGGKAKLDIHDILIERGIESLDCKCIDSENVFLKVINEIHKVVFLLSLLKKNEEIFIVQHPFSHLRAVNKVLTFIGKKKKLIIVIHDLDGLRFQNKKKIVVEKELLKTSEYIISHNAKMSRYLVEVLHVSKENIVDLCLFDYLYRGDKDITIRPVKNLTDNEKLTICYAGNLEEEKVPFIYEFSNHNISYNVNLYGINYNGLSNENISYKGSLPSNELIDKIEGNYGLVWDGAWDSRDKDEPVKRYTKYNNPHKLSLYMACGLPVIVWNKSAVAGFVKKYNIGYTLESLDELETLSINNEEYQIQTKNVRAIQDKVKSGFYINGALDEIIKRGKYK